MSTFGNNWLGELVSRAEPKAFIAGALYTQMRLGAREALVNIYVETTGDELSLNELDLYHLIMDYRAQNGLPAIPLSDALTATAGRHALDSLYNIWDAGLTLPPGANLHSWSDAPYYSDHSQPQVMWDAPDRLGLDYPNAGYEISAAGYGDTAAALGGWQGSSGHNNVILNLAGWSGLTWNAIGIGVENDPTVGTYGGRIYHVWFGTLTDPADGPEILGDAGANSMVGTDFGDSIDGLGADDILDGGLDADVLMGGAGNDTVFGGLGDDTIDGGTGADTLDGGAGSDTADYFGSTAGVNVFLSGIAPNSGGDAEGDVLTSIENLVGSAFNDNLLGDAGANSIEGGDGDDVLLGGLGGDSLDGGAGFDILSGVDGGIADTLVGGVDRDIAYYLDATASQIVDMADHTNLATNSGEHVNDVWIGITGFYGASGFSNTITGDDRQNDLLGGNQADTLFGGAEIDALLGLGGDDILVGGTGGDVLLGGAGTDTLTGGAGADVIYVQTGNGIDIVTDWLESEDFFLFYQTGASGYGDLTFTDTGSDVEITSTADATFTVVVQGAELADLDNPANFLFL